jgi:ribosomal protein S18 acetylase RimI-like enzyme
LQIRKATKGELGSVSDLIVRTKRLNSEFDPLYSVVDDAKARAERYVAAAVDSPDKLLLVAVEGSKVVGVLRAEMRERIFYEPHREGFITDFYILPEYRRKALGNEILEHASVDLKKMGAQIIVAEVPSQNEIAVRFYTKRGFRSLSQLFGRNP